MNENIEALKKCKLFEGIDEDNIPAMLSCLQAKTQVFEKGQTILHEGDTPRFLGIVISGKVQINRLDYYGNRSLMAIADVTEIFGETFACAEISAVPVDVVADERSEIMLIDVRRITKSCTNACEFHSRIIFNLLKMVAQKNLVLNNKIEIISKRTTREKLLAYLSGQAKLRESESFTIPFDRQELSDFLEVDRSGLSAEISKLRKEGILQCRKNHFVLNETNMI